MTPEQAAELARRAFGDPGELVLLRASGAVTFRGPGAIVRVTPTALRPREDVAAELEAVARLSAAGAPVPAPLGPAVGVDDATVTAWEDVPDDGVRDDAAYAAMGRALATLHAVGGRLLHERALRPRPWQPLQWLEERLVRAGPAADPGLAAALRTRAAAEAAGLTGEETLLHTDAHAANFRVAAGRAVLVDLEGLTSGPWRYDLAPMAVGERRYGGEPARWRAMAVAYGTDPDDPALLPAIRLRELLAVGYVFAQAVSDPAAMAVARRRFADVEAGKDAIWHLR